MNRPAVEVLDQGDGVVGQRLQVVPRARHLAVTLAAEIHPNTAKTELQRRHLSLEHPMGKQQAVEENERFGSFAGFDDVQTGVVEDLPGHVMNSMRTGNRVRQSRAHVILRYTNYRSCHGRFGFHGVVSKNDTAILYAEEDSYSAINERSQ